MSIFIRTVPSVMQHFHCSAEVAQRYIDLRDEGYGREQALAHFGAPLSNRTPSCIAGVSGGQQRG